MFKPNLFIVCGTGVDAAEFLNGDTEKVVRKNRYGEVTLYEGSIRAASGNGVSVVCYNRHGQGNRKTNPTETNYRAQIEALSEYGLNWGFGVTAVGSLRECYAPGDLVLIEGIKDDTKFRKNTFFDGSDVVHMGGRHRYCPAVQDILENAVIVYNRNLSEPGCSDLRLHREANLVVIEGPDFNDQLESEYYRGLVGSTGKPLLHVVGMSQQPEADLMREKKIHYANLGVITDWDSWKEGEEVSNVIILENARDRQKALKQILKLAALSSAIDSFGRTCDCATAISRARF